MNDTIIEKLQILADSAKYDVSCSSSGTTRNGSGDSLGNTRAAGICHSYTEDGRCVSLLKIMMTNHCIYDCAYCINRRTNDRIRTTLTPDELVTTTIEFYRRNYIEGLFLSSGVIRNPDYTMELMIRVVKELRTTHHFGGYIHMKSIPGTSRELVLEAGLYADRLSVNIEIPREQNLQLLAPDKSHESIYKPMSFIHQGVIANTEERNRFRHAPHFAPAGQSTQMIIGASNERDNEILQLSNSLYKVRGMRRVYYSGYIHVNHYDNRLPVTTATTTTLVRENRLYQADWLMRFYGFSATEIANDSHPDLELEIDPKLSWALRNPAFFPVDMNKADYNHILRVPGIGVKSAMMIITSRRHNRITSATLKQIGVVMKKAQYFITCAELQYGHNIADTSPELVRRLLTQKPRKKNQAGQLSLNFNDIAV